MKSPFFASDAARSRVAGLAAVALSNALNGLTGADFQVSISESREIEKTETSLIWRQPFQLAEGALFWLVAGKDLWEATGRMVLGGEGVDSVSEQDSRSTWNEVAAQTMSGIAQAMSLQLGREVLAEGGETNASGPDDQVQDAVLDVRSNSQVWFVWIAWSSSFAEAIPAFTLESGESGSIARGTGASKTLELLLDVALPVSVSFGKTSLQIREVLKLNTGSVVELDRQVSEPVEVTVNNCVIARGEVVVVDGNYGVRIIQLASRAERLRSGMLDASSRLGTEAK
jgi:flagellar motor switch protein FliN